MSHKSSLSALKSAQNKVDLAKVLDVTPVFLTNVLYVEKLQNTYTRFQITKKTGGTREICVPADKLKELQRRLSDVLLNCIDEIRQKNKIAHVLSHGFERNKTIITNARKHRRRNIVVNFDLENFFDSFNFGRVRGFFIKNRDFQLTNEVATVIAQIACFDNKLPQGSPCSPVITNLIFNNVDIRLNKIATSNKCTYTRYADDITISTNRSTISDDICFIDPITKEATIGKKIEKEISRANFSINKKKTRVQFKMSRQDVTGLVVNEKVNSKKEYHKKVRAMAYSLFKKGVFTVKDKKTHQDRAGRLNELEGMLGFIDHIDKLNNIEKKKKFPKASIEKNAREQTYADFIHFKNFHWNEKPIIITEGHTDNIYLKCATHALKKTHPRLVVAKGKEYELAYSFFKKNSKIEYLLNFGEGAPAIKKFMVGYQRQYAKFSNLKAKSPVIILLDNDNGSKGSNGIISYLLKQPHLKGVKIREQEFIHIFENLYVIFTPLNGKEDSCIEDLFTDETLQRKLNNKTFNKTNNACTDSQYSKDYFARYVVKAHEKEIDFSGFNPLFAALTKTIDHYKKSGE